MTDKGGEEVRTRLDRVSTDLDFVLNEIAWSDVQ